MRYSSVAECNWEGTARYTLPNVWVGDDQLLSEAEPVRPKQGSSFKRHYFLCLTIFWNIPMAFCNCKISCTYFKKYKSFFHENWLCTTSFKTVRFHWRTLYHKVQLNCNTRFSLSFSFSSLSYDRSKASSKASSPHSAIQSFLFQMGVSSPFLKVIQ